MASFGQIKGGQDFKRVQQRLKETGDRTVRRELNRGINRSVKPLKKAVYDGLKDQQPKRLPTRYAETLADDLKISTRRSAGRNPYVRLVGRALTPRGKKRDLASLNRGRLRHPLFDNRDFWFNQRVGKGWWTDVLNAAGAKGARKEIERTVRDISKKLTKGN